MALKGLKASLGLALVSILTVGCMQPLGPAQRTHMPANSKLGRQLGLNGAARQGATHPYMNVNSGVPVAQEFDPQPPTGGRFGAMRDMLSNASDTITSSLPKMSSPPTTLPSTTTSIAGPLISSPELHIKAAKMQESRGHVAAAVTQLQRAIELQPENPNSWLEFARLYDRAGDLQQASAAYQQAIQLAPNNPTPFNDLGLCFARHGKLQDSIATLNHAVRLQPQRKLYRNNLATVLVTAGLADKAIEHLKQAFPPATANYNLAMMLIQQGNEAEATRVLHQSIRLDPNFTPAQEMLAQLTPTNSPSSLTLSTANATPANVFPADTSLVNTSPVNLTVSPAIPNLPAWQSSDRPRNSSQLNTTQPATIQPVATQPPYAQQFKQQQFKQEPTSPSVSPFQTSRTDFRANHSVPSPNNNFVVPEAPLPGQRHQFNTSANAGHATAITPRSFAPHQLQPTNQPNISFPYYNQ